MEQSSKLLKENRSHHCYSIITTQLQLENEKMSSNMIGKAFKLNDTLFCYLASQIIYGQRYRVVSTVYLRYNVNNLSFLENFVLSILGK